jgi:Lar family restriction alleviation protein
MVKETDTELKPCPFCGDTDSLQTDKMVVTGTAAALDLPGGEDPEEWFVVCGMCSAMGPLSPSSEETHAAWNKRFKGV